jgi:hypothetical protein
MKQRAIGVCVGVCVALIVLSAIPAPAANSIQIENAKPGAADWRLTIPGNLSGIIEGYASLTSVDRGGQIKLFVKTAEPTYTMDIYRLGYYQGLGARRMMATINRNSTSQPACPMDPTTGLIECNWFDPCVLTIPTSSDPTNWMSGIYIVKLTAGVTKTQSYITFTVRDDARFTDLLMQQAVSTYQAYNRWGGKSLYGTLANPSDTANKAMKVSFDRPYLGDDSAGVGQLFNGSYVGWELGMLQWLEKEGYDVSYATSIDLDASPNLLVNHKAFLSVGHDEYWSWKMRDNVESARDAGLNIGFFSGNTSYWQVRFESSVATNQPGRVQVGYKEFWQNDPITPAYLKTNEFRLAPVNRPEDVMLGSMFVTQARPAFCVEDASHWVFTGTGLKNGDCLTNPDGTSFLGYEVDSMIGPGSPANTQRMAHSPVDAKGSNYSDMTMYRAASGATVVHTGSIAWSQTVPQIQQITRNVLARFITNAFADTTPIRPILPVPFASQDIGDTGRAGFVALAGPDSFTLNGAGQDSWTGSDALYYAYQPLTGDGQIIARLTSLRNFWDNRGGVMIRETLAPTAKYVALVGRPSGAAGSINEGGEFWVKDTVGANRRTVAARDQNLPNWLKLTRVGNVFSSYLSPDGTTWTLVGTATVPMGSTAYIGAAVQSAQHAVWATAVFDHVSVSGIASPPALPAPWQQQDIGAVNPPGSATASSGLFTVRGSGANIWGTTDAFHYVYQPLAQDGGLIVRVTSVQNTNTYAKGGIMLRASLTAGSPHVILDLRPTGQIEFMTRTAASGPTSYVSGAAQPTPAWLKLVRAGSTVTGYSSADGVQWALVGTTQAGFGGPAYIGMAVVSVAPGVLNTSTFDNVTTVAASQNTCSALTVTRPSLWSGHNQSNWHLTVTPSDSTCTWTASVDQSWMGFNSSDASAGLPSVTQTGTATLAMRVLTNTTGAYRFGTLTVGTQTFKVTQEP